MYGLVQQRKVVQDIKRDPEDIHPGKHDPKKEGYDTLESVL